MKFDKRYLTINYKRADNRNLSETGRLSALRLCVWLFDDNHIHLFYIN